MEKEKENVIITDDELKDVSGGAMSFPMGSCLSFGNAEKCKAVPACVWKNGKCTHK